MRRALAPAAALALVLAAGCTRRNDAYCCTDRAVCAEVVECGDPERPFCDNDGLHPASGGVGRTCIPLPGEACEGDTCADPATPHCLDGVCVGCVDVSDCDYTAPVCGELDHTCRGCEGPADCSGFADRPLCEDGACVGCRDAADCPSATEPVCDGEDRVCRACRAHGECASGLCDAPVGACVAPDNILHVATDGIDRGGCTAEAPCNRIQLAVDQAAGDRMWIKVAPGTYPETVQVQGKAVRIIGPGALVDADVTGTPVLLVIDADVEVEGLTLRGAGGGPDLNLDDGARCGIAGGALTPRLVLRDVVAVANGGQGVDAVDCQLRVERSTIRQNLGGGLRADGGGFVVLNSVIADNGLPGGSFGGARLDGPIGSRFEHNTVVGNQVADGTVPGVDCNSGLTLVNNIIYGNSVANDDDQIGGGCAHEYSLIGPRSQSGEGNLNDEPEFVGAAAGDYHLAPGSPGIDQGTGDQVTHDIDGDQRPAGGGPDIGADEAG